MSVVNDNQTNTKFADDYFVLWEGFVGVCGMLRGSGLWRIHVVDYIFVWNVYGPEWWCTHSRLLHRNFETVTLQ
jgi:hypothetical protein